MKVEKLQKVEKWPQWKFLIRIILQSNDLIGFVYGTAAELLAVEYKEASEHLKALEKFTQNEYKAQRVIAQSLKKDVMLHVMNSKPHVRCGTSCTLNKSPRSQFM